MSIDTSPTTASVSLDDQQPQPTLDHEHDFAETGRLAPVVDDDGDHEVLLGDYESIDYPDPIEHGHGIEAVLNDLDEDGPHDESFYTRLWRGWQDLDIEPEEEPAVLVEDVHEQFDWLHDDYPAHLVLSSKGWKAGRDAEDGELVSQYYEYSLSVMRYDPDSGKVAADLDDNLRAPVSFQCWVQPQDESLVLPSGDSLVCQRGEGTKLRTQTTYAGSREALVRTITVTNAAANALDVSRPSWATFNRESWRVWKGEVHHRFDSQYMDAVVQRLREARSLLEYGGRADVGGGGDMREGKFVEELVRSNRWDTLGFNGYAARDGYELGVKVYRISGAPRDKRLEQPKLEAYLAGTDSETTLPHADDWLVLRATLRQLASTLAIRSGLNLGLLREDDYYEPRERKRIDIGVPQGWRQAVQEANEARMRRILNTVYSSLSMSKWDILYAIATLNGADYETLSEVTGLTKDYVQEVVAGLVEQDILIRISMPRIICFNNEELRINALDELSAVHADENFQTIKDRAEQRRERREKNRRERQADNTEENFEAESDTASGANDASTESPDEPGSATASSSSADDSADSAAETNASDGPEWTRVDLLSYCREDIGEYIRRGEISAEDVKIRTDRHDWLILR